MLETDQAKALVEGAEERGFIEPAGFEAFTLEHDLNDEEIEELTREMLKNPVRIQLERKSAPAVGRAIPTINTPC